MQNATIISHYIFLIYYCALLKKTLEFLVKHCASKTKEEIQGAEIIHFMKIVPVLLLAARRKKERVRNRFLKVSIFS